MNTTTCGAEPAPQAAEQNQTKPVSLLDVSNQKVAAVIPDAQPAVPQALAPRVTKATPDYSVYLSTSAAEAAAHGIFVVTPDPDPKDAIHTTKKMPETQGNPPPGEGGVKSFAMTAAVAVKTTTGTRLLGRRFGAGDGIIALDCDGWHPPADWTRGTGYREVSASGTGDHIIARIPAELIPAGTNKIKRPHAGGGDIEVFYGRGNGIAISGREATAGPIDLDMDSEAGKMVVELLYGQPNGAGKTQPTEVMTVSNSAPIPVDTTTREERYAVIAVITTERGEKGRALWDGDASDYDNDCSRAEQALMNIIVDVADYRLPLAKDVFLESAFGQRPKIQERRDYLVDRLIHNAVSYAHESTDSPQDVMTDITPAPENESLLYTSTIRIAYRPRQQGWETEAAKDAAYGLRNIMGDVPDFADCGNGVYACRDKETDLWTILTGPEDPVFKRFCGRVFEMAPKPSNTIEGVPSSVGLMPGFQHEFWDMITVHRMVALHRMDCGAPLTCIPTLDGYISLSTGERVERPPTYEYHPFRLNLRTDDAVYNPDHKPKGRVVTDLCKFIGEDTMLYLISLTAALISTPPANRRVTVLTGPPRSSKTTFGKSLGLLGLAPPPEIDFGNEVDGKGKFRANLMRYIGLYPILFVNDPADPDGNVVKRFCDTTQLYERKYFEEISVYQRASVVLTMNNAPDFQTSGMEAKIRYCHSAESYIGQEIAEAEYMATIASDGSLTDIWQLIIRHILSGGSITITEKLAKYDRMMHSRTNAMNKWLGMCKPGREGVSIHRIYLDYMVYANPDSDPHEVIDTCNLHAKQAKWHPRGGIAGESKHRIVTELIARGFERDKKGRLIYITLPGREQETIPTQNAARTWSVLGGHLGRQTPEGIHGAEKGIKKASTGHQKGIYEDVEDKPPNEQEYETDDANGSDKSVRETERASTKKPSYIDHASSLLL